MERIGAGSNRLLRDSNRLRVETMMRQRGYRLLHSPPEAENYDRYHRLPHIKQREIRRLTWLQKQVTNVREDMHRRRLEAQAGIDHRLASLHKPKLGETREEECVVCLQDFEEEDKLRMMPCSHSFHQHCIFDWLVIRDNCPVCRSAMSSKDDNLPEVQAVLDQWIQVIQLRLNNAN